MVQEKSSAMFGHGEAAGLSIAKSADRENPNAVQQRAKQLPQSGLRFGEKVMHAPGEEKVSGGRAGEPMNGFPCGTPVITLEGSTKSSTDVLSALKKWVKARRKESLPLS
ncbi:hypothetical protein [Paenarthrobacter aurescens]|nr:hypothetical protein [Paenarthrobacter aurescens]MDO6142873.1 hypothetical protein [Paenarthrobacter aurescens]MDO6146718.1 hypothetical protein [Paenarthrobacter aurescens]MDO6157964.1 hypothetical protein [Paenarthrobacter aurescens]MDO6161949.1 hypothetical protein [Paenarthrobacter aurescens]